MSYRVAVTSSDGALIDQHFGQTKRFQIVEVQEETGEWQEIESRVVDEVRVAQALGTEARIESIGHYNDYVSYIGDLLNDCHYLLTSKIGMRPYKILQQKGIDCLESPYNLSIAIDKLNRYYLKNKK
jgi:nitrogen fixation protein NifX